MANKTRVLLVDDVRLFLEQERTIFNSHDFEVMMARTGCDALRTVHDERPDLVFMDLHMPDMDGDRCCHSIKSDKELSSIPVIMVTQGGSQEDFERCWQAGCDEIIVKPINRHYFMAVTNRFINVNRRKATRYMAHLRVKYGRSQELLTDYTINLSAGGLFIETENFLPVDASLNIEFILPDCITTIRCKGRVAWVNHPASIKNPNLPAGMGLQFLDLTFDDMDAIRQYIKREELLPSW